MSNPGQGIIARGAAMPSLSRWRRVCLLVLVALAGSACTNRIVYDNADWWLNWYIDDYVKFNREQQRQVDRYLDRQMLWHRKSQLPRYETFLLQVKQDCSGELAHSQVKARFENVYQFWRDFVSEALPASATMLSQLSDSQASDFMANIEKEAHEFEKEYADMTADERAREQQEEAEKSLKKWIGKPSEEQRRIISRWAHAMKDAYSASVEQRKQWQAALALALRERDQPELFRQRLYTLFVSPSESWSPPYRAMMEANESLTAQMLVDIHRSLTAKQRERLFETLDGYIHDIRKLQNMPD